MNRGQVFESRKRYVEDGIGTIMTVKQDFAYIKYARQATTDAEYMRIGDIQGRAVTLDITAKSLEDIFEDISRINLVKKENIAPPSGIVSDPNVLRNISPLFM